MNRGLLSFMVFAAACGVGEVEIDEAAEGVETAEVSDELSAFGLSTVTLRRDTRRCAAPMCGGFFARDVNRSTSEQYVSGLDFSRSGLDAQTQQDVLDGADGEVLVRGRLGPAESRFNTRPLIVLEAWRGLPGVAVRAGDPFYRVDRQAVCAAAPCRSWRATRLNVGTFGGFNELTTSVAVTPLLDTPWLINEALTNGALVAGTVRRVRTTYWILDASQVFLKLPQRASCRSTSPRACTGGRVRVFERGLDRCLTPAACVLPPPCAPLEVECPPGYVVASWLAGAGCPRHACDPAFAR
jgi:hypothetical protein